ncbi:MAG: iron ABC transporter permease [Nitriliruptorales bacterium]|nr:iron ABC transporter permease [Nitriliruptorales bacterium]
MNQAVPSVLETGPADLQPARGGGRGTPRRRAPVGVWLPATIVSVLVSVPLVYLVVRVGDGGAAVLGEVLRDRRTWDQLTRTVLLGTTVTAASILLAVPAAWLTTRTDLPGRRTLGVLLALPLVIPSYVGAFALLGAVAPGGLLESALEAVGLDVRLPRPQGFWGAFLSLTLFTYPYVLLTARGALKGMGTAPEEAARTLGHGPWSVFWHVTVPRLRPAIGAGGLLVMLYVASDFGAVSLMRYSTFTRAIYIQYQNAFDRTPAAVLSLLLVVLTGLVVAGEWWFSRDRGGQFRSSTGRPAVVRLGRWRWLAAGVCWAVVAVALVMPVVVSGWWLVRGISSGQDLGFGWSAALHSVEAGALGAVAAVVAALPVALWAVRGRSRLGLLADRVAHVGFALPGIVVALSLVFFGVRVAEPIYQTLFLLVGAYVVLFLPQALGALRSSLQQISPDVVSAARTLGATRWQAFRRVVFPLTRQGAVAGGALVFLTVVKELPATLLLAPIGFDTLATRVWQATNGAFYAKAAVPALGLILLGSLPLAVLVSRDRD